MRLAGFTLAMAGIFAGNALGQAPTVNSDGTGVMNAISYKREWAANYGVARGSYFVVYGTNFASKKFFASLPLQTTLGGASISVTVNGTTTQALIDYVDPGQINAILPSATPAGTGTFTVTTGAGASSASPIQVVDSAFGLATWDYGAGPVLGFDASIDPKNQYVLFGCSSCPAVNPGDILELYGTGLGPVQGDATGVAVSPTAQVYIGGILATVQYSGRTSAYIAEDQINVVVPQGVSGCYVDVAVVTGSAVSNFGTLAIAPKGSRTCSDTVTPFSAAILNGIAQKGSYSVGLINLSKTTTPGILGIGGGTTEHGSADFFKYTAVNTAGYAGAYAFSSIGSCSVWSFTASAASQTSPQPFVYTSLNAGPDVNISGSATLAMPLQTVSGFSSYNTPSSDTSFIPDTGGTFMFDNGSGGPDVKAFTATLQMAAALVWSNKSGISTVTRSNGVKVSWTGGDSSTSVNITGLSVGSINGNATDFVASLFTCRAPTAAGTFTVSPAVLLSLPASTSIEGISISTLAVSNVSAPASFTAKGLDAGWVSASVEDSINVTYQ